MNNTATPDLEIHDDLVSDSQVPVEDTGGEEHLPEHNDAGDSISEKNEFGDKIASAARKAYRELTGTTGGGGDGPERTPERTSAKPTGIPRGQKLSGTPSSQQQRPQQNQQGNQQDNQQQEQQREPQQSSGRAEYNPPTDWSAGTRKAWDTLPAAVRNEIARSADAYQLGPVLSKYQRHFDAIGTVVGASIRDSIHTMAILNFGDNNQKVALLKRLVQAFNITVRQSSETEQQYQARVQQRHQQFLQGMQQRGQQVQAQRQQYETARRHVDSEFASGRYPRMSEVHRESGAPVYELVARLIENRQAHTIQDAYNYVTRLLPAQRQQPRQSRRADGKQDSARDQTIVSLVRRTFAGTSRLVDEL